ncbi:hypothetical protein OAF54_01750 [bacterium]|nr:hypothetical protein [bacterium]
MNITIDIETIPQQGDALELEIEEAKNNFKAPSSLTKTQAAKDLGITDSKEIKYTSADDMRARWEREMPEINPAIIVESAEKEWRKTSFDGGKGEVISIAWAVEDGEIEGEYRHLGDCESTMIRSCFDFIHHQLNDRPPFFIGHNIEFDLKFLFRRAVVLGIKPPFELPHNGRHGVQYWDNMIAWCGFKDRISQDNLAKALGLKGKPDAIDGSLVWDYVKAGKELEVSNYNIDDVDQCRQIYNKLNFKGRK